MISSTWSTSLCAFAARVDPGAEHRQPDSEFSQPAAEREKIGVHERFATGEDYPLDAESAISAVWRSRSARMISRASLVFQISHITQRQLHRLCG